MSCETLHEITEEILDVVQDRSFGDLGAFSQGTMTLTGLPSLFEEITIHTRTFTFMTERFLAGEITIGSDVDACITNIATAINSDLDYVAAEADTVSDTVMVTVSHRGGQGNLTVFSSDASNLTMDGNGYLGGTVSGSWGDRIRRFLNKRLIRIAAKFKLPVLETSGSVTTVADIANVALPSDYHWDLHRCWNGSQGWEVPIHRSTGAMLSRYHAVDQQGPVYDCAVRGDNLYYQHIPASGSEETLTLYYQAKPTSSNGGQLVQAEDQPIILPEHLVTDLLVNGVLFELYQKTEDGTDGQKVNTGHYMALYRAAERELGLFIGPNDRGCEGFRA